jgi:Arc/MetJ-type ribon-helix-helix transcriptional regulator
MAHMARRTTVVLTSEDVRALERASRAEGLSQSELIRKGVRTVTAAYRRQPRALVGWLKLSAKEREEIEEDAPGD